MTQVGEFEGLALGLDFLRSLHLPAEVFRLDSSEPCAPLALEAAELYPLLMLNVGSGVSIFRVGLEQGRTRAARVAGTCLGGGTSCAT